MLGHLDEKKLYPYIQFSLFCCKTLFIRTFFSSSNMYLREMQPRQTQRGQTGTSEDVPFYVTESGSWRSEWRSTERSAGWFVGSHATASQAKSTPCFICMPALTGYA